MGQNKKSRREEEMRREEKKVEEKGDESYENPKSNLNSKSTKPIQDHVKQLLAA